MSNRSDTPERTARPATQHERTALVSDTGASTSLDANGFDPAAYDWVPILRRPRADGWTHAKQRLFIETLADTASPRQAAEAVGLSLSSAYRLRRSPGADAFAAAWDAAIQQALKRLVDIAYERAVDGEEQPVFDAEGRVIGRKHRFDNRLLIFLLRAHQPERYRHADKTVRPADEAPAPALPHVAQAVAALGPVTPDKPHETMDAEDLEDKVFVADLMEGELPGWHRAEAEPLPGEEPAPDPREKEIDRMLDEVRRRNAPDWRPYEPEDDDEPATRRARRSRRELK